MYTERTKSREAARILLIEMSKDQQTTSMENCYAFSESGLTAYTVLYYITFSDFPRYIESGGKMSKAEASNLINLYWSL